MTASVSTGYVAISRRTLDLEDYIDVARRHVSWIMGPVLAGVVLSTVVAFLLPNVYVSEAEMQITPAQISESIVKTTINQRLTERIMQMEQEILSRTSLSNIIQDPRLDLYKSDRASKPIEDVIEQMRGDVKIHIDSLPGDGGRQASAFSISFSYPDRLKAQATVQALITKFEDENSSTQRTQQSLVNSFVRDELTEAKAQLDKLNEDLTKFRVENSGKLPEQSNMNISELTSLQQQSASINDGLNRLAQERVQLDTHLQTLQDQMQLLDMFDKESPAQQAPAARQENEMLLSLDRTIESTESQLAQLRQIYKPGYPDIRDAEARLKVMRQERDDLQKKQDADQAKAVAAAAAAQKEASSKKVTNFAAARSLSEAQGQIDATKALIKTNEMRRADLMKQQETTNKYISDYQSKLAATSGIEAAYAEMEANQKIAVDRYDALLQKQQLAEQNGALLERKAGEQLDVLDPPSLPQQPAKPNRWMIVGGGTAAGFLLGLVLAGVQEAKDTSLKNLKDVRAYTNLPVLSSIPLLENTVLVRRKRRIAYLAWSAAVIVGMLAVSASFYYHYTSSI